jgi:hypothetical protein
VVQAEAGNYGGERGTSRAGMDVTICLDEGAYEALHARSVREGRAIDELVQEALRLYLSRLPEGGTRSLAELRPEPFPDGNDHLSQEIDAIVYGRAR